mgnify:CR=1 FL=1
MRYKPTYHVTVQPASRFANIVLTVTILAGAICSYFFARSLALSIELSSIFCLLFSLCLLLLPLPRIKPFNLLLTDSGSVTFWFDHLAQLKVRGHISEQSYATSFFCLVRIKSNHENNPKRLLIWKDSARDCDYRRLCRVIRLTRNQI